MNFKCWFEHEYLQDRKEDEPYRVSASDSFIDGLSSHPNPEYDSDFAAKFHFRELPKDYEEKVPNWRNKIYPNTHTEVPAELSLKGKRIVLSKYRHPPIVLPISNGDISVDKYHGFKPQGGLWYALGNAWIQFAQGMPAKMGSFVHEVMIDTNRILVLNDEESCSNFERRYGVKQEKSHPSDIEFLINWPNVVKDYAGIEISGSGLHRQDWQEYWDIPSGVIWDKLGLKDSKLLYVYNIKTKKYVRAGDLGVYAGRSSRIRSSLPAVQA